MQYAQPELNIIIAQLVQHANVPVKSDLMMLIMSAVVLCGPILTQALAPKSANPGGRPRAVKEVVELARQITPKAIACLEQILDDRKTPAIAKIQAAREILDRGLGKAPVSLLHDLTVGLSGDAIGGGSVLLRVAHEDDDLYENRLRAELRRLEAKREAGRAEFEKSLTARKEPSRLAAKWTA
jgi:hypothetical protein